MNLALTRATGAMASCIENCIGCAAVCTETSIHCLERGGAHADSHHVRLLLDCAEICRTSADFMLRGSDLHSETCAVCADVCDRCADECERMARDDQAMQRCAEACRRCAESCRQMAGGTRVSRAA
ncbi:MAG: ferredoxin [Proteobacteria bacterium]|nr:MAG: ferredoxin [Pseudomonadota bacterium]